MVLFVNDTPIHFVTNRLEAKRQDRRYEIILGSERKLKAIEEWQKHVLVPNASVEIVAKFLFNIRELKTFNFKSATFVVPDIDEVEKVVEAQYKIVNAGGGVILNEKKEVLMIYRLKMWDLPKGKAEKGETIKETAIREVEEECGVKVTSSDEFFISNHSYLHKNQYILKRSYWFKMTLLSDEGMQPQCDEGIEEIRWMNRSEMHKALKKSYSSIRYVLDNMLSQELSFSKG